MQPRIVGPVAALVASAGLLSPTAYADGSVVLGGGAGITVNGTNCTLATIGHDNTGELVGFTAASCGGPGSQVTAADGGTPVGSVVAADDQLKYAVIKFDPAKAIPTANFAGFAINGIGPDPDFRQPACTDGAVTGIQCGLITTMPGPGPGRNMNGWPVPTRRRRTPGHLRQPPDRRCPQRLVVGTRLFCATPSSTRELSDLVQRHHE